MAAHSQTTVWVTWNVRTSAWLLTLCMLAATPGMGIMGGADAAPMAPDWSSCKAVGNSFKDCCTLTELLQQPLRFKELHEYLRDRPLPDQPRVRPAAHLVASNRTYVQQLERAYRLVRELPATDPRSLAQQTHLHCMYGGAGAQIVMQLGFPTLEYSVHRTRLWLPFHRWFTFFFERILGDLVGDPQFALPFWNWDDQSSEVAPGAAHLANVIPHFYRDPQEYPALFDIFRHPKHAPCNPDYLLDLSPGYSTPEDRLDDIRRTNNRLLHTYVAWTSGVAPLITGPGPDDDSESDDVVPRHLAAEAEPRVRFLSLPVHAGDSVADAQSARTGSNNDFEYQIHGGPHGWLPDPAQGMRDMGLLYTSVCDPLFVAQHANVDRLCAVWQSLGGRDYDHPDFLDAAFFFCDEDGVVRVTVRDALDHRTLMLDWQQFDNPWLRYESESHPPAASGRGLNILLAAAADASILTS